MNVHYLKLNEVVKMLLLNFIVNLHQISLFSHSQSYIVQHLVKLLQVPAAEQVYKE